MKIDSITLQNFRCFEHLDLKFDKSINFIFGPNASGKSTIAEAMEVALTGRCNGVNSNWRDRAALVRHGADQFKVELELIGEKVIHRPELRDCSPKPEAISKKLNVSKEALVALFDTGHFFSLHPDEKKRVIFELLDLNVNRSNIKRKLKSWLREHPSLIEKYPVRVSNRAGQVDPDDDLLSVFGTVPGSLEEAYTQAFDERRLVKRELKALGPIVDLPDGITEDEIKARIDQNQKELSSLHERLGKRKGIQAFERKQIEAELEGTSSTLEQLESEIRSFKPKSEKARLSRLEKKREEALQEIESLNKELASRREALDRLRVEREAEERLIERLRNFNGTCPLFDRPIECKTEEVLSAISEYLNNESRLDVEIDTLSRKATDIQLQIQNKKCGLSSIEQEISTSKDLLTKHEENLEAIKKLKEKKAELEQRLRDCEKDDSEGLRERIKQLEMEMEKNRRLLQAAQREEKRKLLSEKLNILEVLVQAFSPKGIMADLLSKAVKSLNESLAETMKKLTSGKYSLEINVNDDVDIHLINHQTATRTNIKLASSSERFRAGIVVQAVLSGLTGLRFMLIDGLDILDQENKGFFFRFIQEVKKDFDNIFVFCTIGQYAPQNPGLSDMDFWVIEDREVRRIPATLRKAA